jgi:BirA family biotin operon repressor/biotin-[acetyl-CoA-carboxylase] ligase
VALTPDVVLPALRGGFGRDYHYAAETETTQRMLPDDAPHGAVALAESQTAGRGRLGRTWVDSALMFSVLLRPPPPVARWPELTLVAARAVADAIGPEATIKDPNDVLVNGRKVAGILAEALGRTLDGARQGAEVPASPAPERDAQRVVLGIGINVGGTAWPGAGWVERDRLELLVDVLERLERGYGEWLSLR